MLEREREREREIPLIFRFQSFFLKIEAIILACADTSWQKEMIFTPIEELNEI